MARHHKGLILAAAAVLCAAAFLAWAFFPDRRLDEFLALPGSRRILDRNGAVIAVLPLDDGLRREYVPVSEIPEWIRTMFIKSEDRFFYFHPGIDPGAVVRAAATNAKAGRIESGASTITMQLAGMIWPGRAGYPGKAAEAMHALKLEARFSKQRILELWLNHLPFGNNVEGVSSAATAFYGKDLSTLSPSEVLMLTIIPRRPGLYTPVTDNEALLTAAESFASIHKINAGDLEEVISAPKPTAPFPNKAPHFTRFLRTQLDEGNAPVCTGLDLGMQETVADLLATELAHAEQFRISNGAVLIIENASGEILCYLGSGDWNDSEHSGQIDGIRMLRQPGSTLKPFLYAMAMEHGFTPATMLADIPLTLGSEEVYAPQNYDNRFRGPVLLRRALASSLNIPAVETVVRLGVLNFADVLIGCGFESIKAQRPQLGSGIVVGNGEVSLFELVQGFSVFARDGAFIPATPFCGTSVSAPAQVFDPVSAVLVRDILTRRINNPFSAQQRPFEGVFKTGTSNQFNNIWAIGSSKRYTIGVWMGNFSGETVMGKPGSSIPLSLAARCLLLLDGSSAFPPAEHTKGISRIKVCSLSGMLAAEYCPGSISELVPSISIPQTCTVHGPKGTKLPREFQAWAHSVGGEVDLCPSETAIDYPADGAVFYFDPSLPEHVQTVTVKISGSVTATIFFDGTAAASGILPAEFPMPLEPGSHRIEVKSGENLTLASSRFDVFE